MQPKSNISFVTLSNLVLDQLYFTDREPLTDVIGGPGAYSSVGARLFLGDMSSTKVGWMIYAGSDFPKHIEEIISSWNCTLIWLKDPHKRSTSGALTYHNVDMSLCTFRDISPPLRLTSSHFESTVLLASSAFHFLGTPSMLAQHLPFLWTLRERAGINEKATFIWEPEPRACRADTRESILQAAQLVDVISPNHFELSRLYGKELDVQELDELDRSALENYAKQILDSGVGVDHQGAVVVRAAEHGCFVVSRSQPPHWVPAYYNSISAAKGRAKDATSAGNTFLGAFAVGLLETGSLVEALKYGAVGASFALEQIGPPIMDKHKVSQENAETWNQVRVRERLHAFQQRLSTAGNS